MRMAIFSRPLVVASLAAISLVGCTSQPTDRDGNPLTMSSLTGGPGYEGEPVIDRATSVRWSYERVALPSGQSQMVLCSAEGFRMSQAELDNMDANTRLAFFKALRDLGATYMSAGIGSYFFGFTEPTTEENINIRGRWSEEWNGTGEFRHTVRKEQQFPNPD